MNFGTVLYESKERVATITLNRPERFNAISETMPEDLAAAFGHANKDDSVHVLVLTGAGRGFCGGYDLKAYAEKPGANPAIQEMPWDPMIDYGFMSRCTQNFMSIWRCHKPVIARVHGDAIAGGSDIALCCDIIIMNEKARIGYPPSRVWGCPTTAMWVYRLGAEKAKQMLFTGDLISGTKAEEMGLIFQSVPLEELDEAVNKLWGWQAPKQSQLYWTAWPGIVLKVFGLRNVQKKSALKRPSLSVTREIRYRAVKNELKALERLTFKDRNDPDRFVLHPLFKCVMMDWLYFAIS
jgi:enoyl-CoA hydratase